MKKLIVLSILLLLISCKKETSNECDFLLKKIESQQIQIKALQSGHNLLLQENRKLSDALKDCENYLDVLEETKTAP